MKNKHKFKPFDRVLTRTTANDVWECDFYSHYIKDTKHPHRTIRYFFEDENILPLEGNEHLVGTIEEPEEEIKLEEGECIVCSDYIPNLESNHRLYIAQFDSVGDSVFVTNQDTCYKYIIRLSDFNPNDMEETKKYVLCVKNGKIVKYKE